MRIGKPGISSFDKFATGHAIRTELRAMGADLFNLNSSLMKLSNGDEANYAPLDPAIGAREVKKVSSRKIGGTVSTKFGGLGPSSTPARVANLLGNPYARRYEDPYSSGAYNFGLPDSPMIGQYYDVYESEGNQVKFMDETIGQDLLGYTHLENAAKERSGEAMNDELYLRGTYSVFNNLRYPFDNQDIEPFRLGSKRYGPSEPYVLKPLETELVRRTMNGSVQGFKEKFEAVTEDRAPYMGSMIDMWDYMGSHYYLNILNGVAEHGLYVENYEYDPRNRVMVYDSDAIPQSDYDYFLDVDTIRPDREIKGLLGKTNRMFYEGKIRSLVNRFATLNGNNEGRPDFLNTATDHLYGLSRGRNLRKLNLTNENGYPNPYCRVWTTHHQYSKYKHLIRGRWADDSENSGVEHYTLHREDQLMRPNKGYERLRSMSSLDPENGRPIFAPFYTNNRDEEEAKDTIKRCMFSIENLAWKDIIADSTLVRKDANAKALGTGITTENGAIKEYTLYNAKGLGMTLTPEQQGPNGGRIMWFPPYNLKFNEQAHANWNHNEFIGRGEKVFSYVNSDRTGSLSFTLLVDHPSIINEWTRGGKQGKTANKANPLSKDEMILRYFAGCDALEFNPRAEYDVPYCAVTTTNIDMDFNVEDSVVTTEPIGRSVIELEPSAGGEMTFYSVFYFPNDYSGVDFKAKDALEMMFNKGQRSGSGVGYERNQGGTGMTYNDVKGTAWFYKGKGKDNVTREWYYPVDERVNDEVLGKTGNTTAYEDRTDFGLNTSFYGSFWGDGDSDNFKVDKILDYLNNGNSGINNDKDHELAKSLVGLPADEEVNKYIVPAYNFYNNLKTVITNFESATKGAYKYEIDIVGYASKQGTTDSNSILSSDRANTIEAWIRSLGVFDFENRDKISANGNGEIKDTNTTTESDFKPKASRAAVVKLKLIQTKTILTETQKFVDMPIVEETLTDNTTVTTTTEEIYDTSNSLDYENQTYDNEYTYFKRINENDDMVKRYISDKVDYFDPAYHSITPEGFNARLTFLHQCTRQGPTISTSDIRGMGRYGAGNLSFGRAPFCVLRIGDFYNTKICIDNIQIDYDVDGLHWDLNSEGVGLQPMMANITINFTFLGGSDLSGPISRLQNAASYNYYANTSVYDRRADYRDNFVTKEEDTAKSWTPAILDKNEKANITQHVDFHTRDPKDGYTKR